jgi:putative IMPACT (imprinted ancient) family translation regulator
VTIRIYSGEILNDRKSQFQAHVAGVTSVEDVKKVKHQLLCSSKIANAAHPCIMAYCLSRSGGGGGGGVLIDSDDDGETGASQKLVFLLETMKLVNVVVVVTRWFGGIQLGADRFKHIASVARQSLLEWQQQQQQQQQQQIQQPLSSSSSKSAGKQSKSKHG